MHQITSGVATDVGRVRQLNEDCVYAGTHLFLVADGMGGHAAGDVASNITASLFADLDGTELTVESLRGAVVRANVAILDYGSTHPETAGLGTTVAGIARLAYPVDHWGVFHVGDSRVYLFDNGDLASLTIDHSEVAELVGQGLISEADALVHPSRNVVTRAVGEWPTPEVDIVVLPEGHARRFVICSDGLTGEVVETDIAAILGAHVSAQEAAALLVRAAVAHGGHDNVSVVVVDEPVDIGTVPDRNRTVPRHIARSQA